MAWPTPQDYNEAIQNPQTAFADTELRTGKPELNALQLPRAITGQFASVYKMQCAGRMWAVRCFLRNVPNQQQRYEAISAHLAKAKLPYIVDFEYQPQGIRVRGQPYPILKMAWVNGESLTRYIETHLASPGLLGNLAYRWLEMTRALRRAGVAHGDLQHGNVLVRNDALMLVDYDGMFVPSLAGQMSYETGHRNFQHPQRNEQHFDAQIDNFSAWVIYLSLHALRVEPMLWQRFAGGDECLLLRRRDFEAPEQSELLKALSETNDAHLRSAAVTFRSLLAQRVGMGAIPALDLQPHTQASPPPSWLADHVGAAQQRGNGVGSTSARPTPATAPQTPDGTLLDDALSRLKGLLANAVEPAAATSPAITAAGPTLAPLFFEHNPMRERLLAYATFAINIALTVSMALGAVPVAMGGAGIAFLLLANVIIWVENYQRDTAVVAREQVHADIFERRRDENKLAQRLPKQEREREKAQRKLAEPARKLEQQHERMKASEQTELDKLRKQTQARIATLQAQMQAAQHKEDQAIRKSRATGEAQMAELQRQIGNLGQAEADEMVRRLRVRQQQFVLMALYQYAIEDVQLPGLTKGLKARLRGAGVVTAADMDQHGAVMGEIAPEHVAGLMEWREYLEAQARAVAPGTLQPAEVNIVRKAYARRREQLEGEWRRWQVRLSEEERAFRAQSRAQQDALNQQVADARARLIKDEEQTRGRYTQRYVQLGADISRAMQSVSPQLQAATEKLADSQRQLSALQVECEQLEGRLRDEYRAVNFLNYVRWILFGAE